jgi:hypothetical protein
MICMVVIIFHMHVFFFFKLNASSNVINFKFFELVKQSLHPCLEMFNGCIWLYYKQYEDVESYIIHF